MPTKTLIYRHSRKATQERMRAGKARMQTIWNKEDEERGWKLSYPKEEIDWLLFLMNLPQRTILRSPIFKRTNILWTSL